MQDNIVMLGPLIIYVIIFISFIILSVNYSIQHKLARILILILFILVAINPKKTVKKEIFEKNIVLVVLDNTLSISQTKKIIEVDTINKFIETNLNKYKNFIKKDLIIQNSNKDNVNKGTYIFSALKKELNKIKKQTIAGIIIVTDGQIHDVSEYNSQLDNIPLHFILVGKQKEKDRILKTENIPEYSMVGQNVNFSFLIEDFYTKENIKVDIIIDGIVHQSKKVKANKKYKVSVPIYHAGENVLEIKVSKLSNEISQVNNYQVHKIKGIHDRLRVMLISGEPNMGLRSLRNLLNSDPSIELLHFTILRPPSKRDFTPVKELSLIPFPTQELFAADISKFSLIIFDQYSLQGVLPQKYLDNIKNFVLNGGALLDIAGPEYAKQGSIINSPLKLILPTKPLNEFSMTPFKPELTTTGQRHPITNNLSSAYQDNAWGNWHRFIKTEKVAGKVLLKYKNYPLMVAAKAGEGRVVQLLSDQYWIWKKSAEERGPLTRLIRNTIHWLLKTPELEENFLKFIQKENIVNVSLNTLLPGDGQALVTSPTNKNITFLMKDNKNGILKGKFTSNELGRHKIEINGITKFIYLGQKNLSELEDIRSTDVKITSLIEKKNITSYWYEEGLPEILIIYNNKNIGGKNWIGVLEKEFSKNSQYITKEYFNWYLLLTLFLILIIYSWFRESKD